MADARYFRVSPKLWAEPGWDDDARLLALYLLTCEHRTTEGLFRLPKQYICADLEWSPQRLAQPFDRLIADGFIDYDEDAKVMLIIKALAYQSPSNPNGVKAALSALAILPRTTLYDRFYDLAERYCQRLHEQLPEPLAQPPAPAPAPAPKPLAPDKPTRKPDPIWDAVMDACGIDQTELTSTARGACNKAVKELRAIGATPDGIYARAKLHLSKWPDVSLTPTSLAKNYAQLAARPNGRASPKAGASPPEVGSPEWEAREREQDDRVRLIDGG